MNTTWLRTMGIVGGLGPHAHVALEQRLLEASARFIGRDARDQDYPPWVLSSYPNTPDRTRALVHHEASPVDAIVESMSRLGSVDFAVIPCNTAHAFLDEIREQAAIPVMDMVGVAIQAAADRGGPVGLLATDGTLAARVFQDRAEAMNLDVRFHTLLEMDDGVALQESLTMTPIYGGLRDGTRVGGGIKSGAIGPQQVEPLMDGVARLSETGAGAVILGCTEIPLALRDRQTAIPCIDPMEVVAEAAVSYASGSEEFAWAVSA